MAKKIIVIVSIMIILGFSLLVAFPIVIFSNFLAPYSSINENVVFFCTESNISAIEELNLNVDVGNIQVNFVNPEVEYAVKIDVNFEMIGSNLAGKSYFDYFLLNWQNTSSPLNFTMELLSDSWFDTSIWITKKVDINIFIRMDAILDLITTIEYGDFEILVPFGVSIESIFTNVTNGDIFYDFYLCTLGSSVTGITKIGNVRLNSFNVIYIQNSNWVLNTELGNMDINIDQDNEMGWNITGTAMIIDGMLQLFYKDNTANIGAFFFFPNFSGDPNNPQEGFYTIFQSEKTWFISSDFPTINNYILTFYITNPCPTCRILELYSA
ncbi:MAG: hypothetical protein ACFFEY_10265 [Candidatus Thorarchaeota archaeon]